MSETVNLPRILTDLVSNAAGVAGLIRSGDANAALLAALAAIVAVGFAIHGLVLGGVRPGLQTISACAKAPLVPLLSLLITAPLLHTVALSMGGGWSLAQTVSLALVPLAVTAILLAASSPLLLFFGSTSDYHFTKLLHVGATALCAMYGVATLLRVLRAASGPNSAIFVVWVMAFFFVSAQMAWILRPFIGSPDKPFRWIAGRGDGLNFYSAVALSVAGIMAPRPAAPPTAEASSTRPYPAGE